MKIILLIVIFMVPASNAFSQDYFVGNLAQSNAYIAKMDTLMGYPNPATKTTTYAEAQNHENDASKYLVVIKSVHSPTLGRKILISEIDTGSSSADIIKRKNRSVLDAEGAFNSE